MSDEPLILRPGEYARGGVTIPPYPSDRTVMLDDDSRVIRDGDELAPARSWQSALRQLADALAPGANIEIDPSSPEVSCARIAEVVQHRETQKRQSRFGVDVAKLPQDELLLLWAEVVRYGRYLDIPVVPSELVSKCPHGVPHRWACGVCDREPIQALNPDFVGCGY